MEHPVKRIVRPDTGGTGQTKKYPQVGETLSSGYTVIANYHNRHVLAHNELAPQPYAIWDLDQDGDTVTGRYFCEVSRAEKRFAEICFPWFDEPLCDHEASRLRNLLQSMYGDIQMMDEPEPTIDDQTEIRIILEAGSTDLLGVFINGDEITDLKNFSIDVGTNKSGTYRCERYIPIPIKYHVNFKSGRESLT